MDIQKEIYELIVAYLRGELSGEELDRLRGWMAIDEKHRRLVEELRDKKVCGMTSGCLFLLIQKNVGNN